jgi:hypothetical protein
MHLDDEAVRTRGESRARHRWNQVRSARAVRWIGNDRQMGELPGERQAGEIECVPQIGIVSTERRETLKRDVSSVVIGYRFLDCSEKWQRVRMAAREE